MVLLLICLSLVVPCQGETEGPKCSSGFLSTITKGLCAVIGQHHIYARYLYNAVQVYTTKVATLQQEA